MGPTRSALDCIPKRRALASVAWVSGEDCFDVLADVEPAVADLDAGEDVAACPVFDGRDGGVEKVGDLSSGHDVACAQARVARGWHSRCWGGVGDHCTVSRKRCRP